MTRTIYFLLLFILVSISSLVIREEINEEIAWVSLQYNGVGYETARNAIIDYLSNDFTNIKKTKNKDSNEIPIAICFYDLNHDNNLEIIAFISDTEFCGANDSGGLFIFDYDGTSIRADRRIAGFPLDVNTITNSDSKQIGIIINKKGWDMLYVNTMDKYMNNQYKKTIWETDPY